jgi:uncharacterized protein with HEPN domain
MAFAGLRVRCEDILDEIKTATGILAGRGLEELRDDKPALRAIERCIEIVSEATRHLPEHATARHPSIPWRSIRGVGNILRHEYGRVDTRLIWQIASVSLPELKQAVESILSELPPDSDG